MVSDARSSSVPNPSQTASPNVAAAIERVLKASQSSGKSAFLARTLNALARLASAADERSLTEATGASSDYDVLLQALEEPEAIAILRQDDPLAPARLRGLRAREELLAAEGGWSSSTQLARLLGITRQAVDKRRRAGQLIGLSLGRRGYAYPSWQVQSNGELLPGLEPVLRALSEHDPWMQAAFFLNRNSFVNDQRPLDLLREGRIEPVVSAARRYGEQVAA